MTLYFYKIIFFFLLKLHVTIKQKQKKRENIFIFKKNMLILIDI